MTITNNAAYEIPDFTLGILEANVDMSTEATWQFTAVGVAAASGTGLLGLSALVRPAAGAKILGILQNNPVLAEAGEVTVTGVSKAKAGGTFVAGADLMVDASGLVVLATTGNHIVATALQPGVLNQVTSILLQQSGIAP